MEYTLWDWQMWNLVSVHLEWPSVAWLNMDERGGFSRLVRASLGHPSRVFNLIWTTLSVPSFYGSLNYCFRHSLSRRVLISSNGEIPRLLVRTFPHFLLLTGHDPGLAYHKPRWWWSFSFFWVLNNVEGMTICWIFFASMFNLFWHFKVKNDLIINYFNLMTLNYLK